MNKVQRYRNRRSIRLDANNRLPFALCKEEGIEIGKDWTPHDAWEALEKKTGKKQSDYTGGKTTVKKSSSVKAPKVVKKAKNQVADEIREIAKNNEDFEQADAKISEYLNNLDDHSVIMINDKFGGNKMSYQRVSDNYYWCKQGKEEYLCKNRYAESMIKVAAIMDKRYEISSASSSTMKEKMLRGLKHTIKDDASKERANLIVDMRLNPSSDVDSVLKLGESIMNDKSLPINNTSSRANEIRERMVEARRELDETKRKQTEYFNELTKTDEGFMKAFSKDPPLWQTDKEYGKIYQELDERIDKVIAIQEEFKEEKQRMADAFVETMKIVRGDEFAENAHYICRANKESEREDVSKQIDSAIKKFPQSWMSAMEKKGLDFEVMTGRSFYSPEYGQIGINKNGYENELFHELIHLFENSSKEFVERERAFYEHRTKGEKSIPLGGAYDEGEVYKPDHFKEKYMGKDYGRNGAFELCSVGLSSLVYGDDNLIFDGDDELKKFMLGIMCGVK